MTTEQSSKGLNRSRSTGATIPHTSLPMNRYGDNTTPRMANASNNQKPPFAAADGATTTGTNTVDTNININTTTNSNNTNNNSNSNNDIHNTLNIKKMSSNQRLRAVSSFSPYNAPSTMAVRLSAGDGDIHNESNEVDAGSCRPLPSLAAVAGPMGISVMDTTTPHRPRLVLNYSSSFHDGVDFEKDFKDFAGDASNNNNVRGNNNFFNYDDNNNNNNNNNATNGATSRANGNFAAFSKAGGYAYTTDFSGGYYRKSPPPSCGDTASSHRNYRRCESQDSFFDDVLKSPRNDANTSSSSSAGDGNHASHAAPQQTQSQRPIHRTTHTKSKQKGIGFSLAPLGKHLSIHVPSRHEIVMAMSRGERLHNFGTRVTLTSMESKRIHRQDGGERGDGGDGGKNRQRDGSLSLFNCANGEEEVEQEMEPKEGNRVDEQVEDDGKENIRQSVREDYDDDGIRVTDASGNLYGKAKGGTIPTSDDRHGISEKQPSKRRPTRKIVSTTTRFANGTQRVVKRTAYLHSDGTREVVVEENGVERRRYLVDGLSAQESEGGKENNTPGRKGCDASSSPESGGTGESDGTNSGKGNGNNGRDRSWYLNIFETCFAPCGGPAMVT